MFIHKNITNRFFLDVSDINFEHFSQIRITALMSTCQVPYK